MAAYIRLTNGVDRLEGHQEPHLDHTTSAGTKSPAMHLTRVLRAAKPNLTGFTTKGFLAATKTPVNDPWARHEAWRYSGPFTRWNRFKGSFPGLGIATVAFAAYCGYEYMFLNDEHGHAEGGHGEGHH